jgi:hypothetical protein
MMAIEYIAHANMCDTAKDKYNWLKKAQTLLEHAISVTEFDYLQDCLDLLAKSGALKI